MHLHLLCMDLYLIYATLLAVEVEKKHRCIVMATVCQCCGNYCIQVVNYHYNYFDIESNQFPLQLLPSN